MKSILCLILFIIFSGKTNTQITIWTVGSSSPTYTNSKVPDTIQIQSEDSVTITEALHPDFLFDLPVGNTLLIFKKNSIEVGNKSLEVERPGVLNFNIQDFQYKVTLSLISGGDNSPETNTIISNLSGELTPVHDALLLSKTNNDGVIVSTLQKYGIHSTTDNPFLKNFIQSRVGAMDFSADASSSGNIPTGGIGGLDVTKYVDGLAKFLVSRTKEELNIAFFNKLRNVLNDTTLQDFQDLFPNARKGLDLIGDDIYQYKQYIQQLRELFAQDLLLLPSNFPKIIDNHPDFFNSRPYLEAFIQLGSQIAEGLREHEHPGEILDQINFEKYNHLSADMIGTFELAQLVSKVLRDSTSGAGYWVSEDHLRDLLQDKTALKIFLGFVYSMVEKVDKKATFNTSDIQSILDKWADPQTFDQKYNQIKSYFSSLADKITYIDRIIKTSESEAPLALALQYYNGTSTFFQQLLQFNRLFMEDDPRLASEKEKITRFLSISRGLSNMMLQINYQNYSAAISDLASTYLIVFPENDLNSAKQYKYLIRFGGFMAAMVVAEDSEALASVIEAFALPAGSSYTTRTAEFTIALNAYSGLITGIEKERSGGGNEDWMWGVTAPVGLGLYWGGLGKVVGDVGINFTLIDIGAITAFRFNQPEDAIASVYLKEIISPGVGLSLGLGRLPIAINVGYQKAPLLQRIGTGENEVGVQYLHRVAGNISVDIPLTFFYTRPKD